MINGRKAANAMGGKTARACDGCLRKRACWFCAAHDAFLCQVCDSSVHSANQLASRHERVRLETASSKTGLIHKTEDSPPSWHQGFTRKARTSRHHSNKSMLVQQELKLDKEDRNMMINNPISLVPELSSEEEGNMLGDEKDDQLLCRVPVFNPFEAELCEILTNEEGNNMVATDHDGNYGHDGTCPANDLDNIQGFLPSDLDLAEFEADVENLLGAGLHEDYNSPNDVKDIERLFDGKDEDNDENFNLVSDQAIVKIKDELEMETIADCHFDQEFHMSRVSLMDWNFDYESPMTADDEEDEKVVPVMAEAEVITASGESKKEMKRNISLRLNYDAVITAWATQGSPWTTGSRPELNPDDDCWPNCTDACRKAGEGHRQYGGIGVQKVAGGDGGREARVMRYKEKRRTRLFSKKIRYEVRKMNAEKRPRMKGRFVKRTSFMGAQAAFPAATAYLNNNK